MDLPQAIGAAQRAKPTEIRRAKNQEPRNIDQPVLRAAEDRKAISYQQNYSNATEVSRDEKHTHPI